MEYSSSMRCGAPACTNPPLWAFAAALPDVPAEVALARADVELRCGECMTLAALTWLPGVGDGLVVVVGTVDSPEVLPSLVETVRMHTHLIDVAQLRPRGRHSAPPSVTRDATVQMPAITPDQLGLPDPTLNGGRQLLAATGRKNLSDIKLTDL